MSLLLRDVHYTLLRGQRAGECRTATVLEAGINPDCCSAELYVDLEYGDIGAEGEVQYAGPDESWPLSSVVADVVMGHTPGTFHIAADCKNRRTER